MAFHSAAKRVTAIIASKNIGGYFDIRQREILAVLRPRVGFIIANIVELHKFGVSDSRRNKLQGSSANRQVMASSANVIKSK